MAEINRDVATAIKPPSPDRELLSCLELIFGWLLLLEQAWLARDRSRSSLGRWYHSSLINGGYPAGPPILSLFLFVEKSRREREREFLLSVLKIYLSRSLNNNSRVKYSSQDLFHFLCIAIKNFIHKIIIEGIIIFSSTFGRIELQSGRIWICKLEPKKRLKLLSRENCEDEGESFTERKKASPPFPFPVFIGFH